MLLYVLAAVATVAALFAFVYQRKSSHDPKQEDGSHSKNYIIKI